MKIILNESDIVFRRFRFSKNAKVQEFEITSGTNSGSNGKFRMDELNYSAGKRVVMRLDCDSGICSGYAFITANGINIVTGQDYYQFKPNTTYDITERINAGFFTQNYKCGCYVNSGHATGNGQAMFRIEIFDD